MVQHNELFWAALVGSLVVHSTHATQFLTIEQAQTEIFPGVTLRPRIIVLTPPQIATIESKSGIHLSNRIVRLWQGNHGEVLFIDSVLGKHELISYAIGITPPGTIHRIEILEYREHYGMEIRNPAWLQQFVGKNIRDESQLPLHIGIISGATFSSRHLTEGIQRILATYALLYPMP